MTRDAEATETFASRATVVIVGTALTASSGVSWGSCVSISEKDY